MMKPIKPMFSHHITRHGDSADCTSAPGWSARAFLIALALLLISCATAWLGVTLGARFVPPSAGFPQVGDVQEDLFRFDSIYYFNIAHDGYSYSGDPNSSPNIVFAPLFPILVSVLNGFGMDMVMAGFLISHMLLYFAFYFLFLFLNPLLGPPRAFLTLLAMATAAGSYAFHAFYSESTMLFCLALSLLAYQRRWRVTLAIAAMALGASRLAALPMVSVFSVHFLREAFQRRTQWLKFSENILGAFLCIAGALAYLVYIGHEFGNPLYLLPAIQAASWGRFHPPVDWAELLSGGYFFTYWRAALGRAASGGWGNFLDIQTLNLLWMSLALVASVYTWVRFRWHLLTFIFGGYFLFVYWSDAGSEFLISSHRFFVLMLPIFIMFCGLHDWIERKTSSAIATGLTVILLLLNFSYGLLHTAFFNQGVWYYF